MLAGWQQPRRNTAEAEQRMTEFTELVATAIGNAESRAELVASRARVVAASDDTARSPDTLEMRRSQTHQNGTMTGSKTAQAIDHCRLTEVRASAFRLRACAWRGPYRARIAGTCVQSSRTLHDS
jgi:hypothetical protein